ncbi:MAG TPA: SGNH/GDSL hydrolase family protein [Polyangiales bacterium]|jgi:lysophospholipase L1-like esterase
MKLFFRSLVLLSVSFCFGAACKSTGGGRNGVGGSAGAGQAGSFSSAGAQATSNTQDAGLPASGSNAGASGGPDAAATTATADTGASTAGTGVAGSGGQSTDGGGAGADAAPAFEPCPATGDCKVLPLGDSITYGSTTNNGGYRVELFTRAHADNKHLTFVGSQQDGPNMVAGVAFPQNNEGHPGWTIDQITNIADTNQALKDSPRIVLLHIGTNDMGSMSTGASDRLEQLITKIVTALPNALLVVSSIIPLPWTDATVTTYNATIPGIIQKQTAHGRHVIYVEMHQDFPSNGLGTDNIHPTDNIGYPWMGDRWYTAITSYLH